MVAEDSDEDYIDTDTKEDDTAYEQDETEEYLEDDERSTGKRKRGRANSKSAKRSKMTRDVENSEELPSSSSLSGGRSQKQKAPSKEKQKKEEKRSTSSTRARKGGSSKTPKNANRGNLPKKAVEGLKKWLFDHFQHPYPTDPEKEVLSREFDLTLTQVNNWFINARRRIWKPLVEEKQKNDLQQRQQQQQQLLRIVQQQLQQQDPSSKEASQLQNTHQQPTKAETAETNAIPHSQSAQPNTASDQQSQPPVAVDPNVVAAALPLILPQQPKRIKLMIKTATNSVTAIDEEEEQQKDHSKRERNKQRTRFRDRQSKQDSQSSRGTKKHDRDRMVSKFQRSAINKKNYQKLTTEEKRIKLDNDRLRKDIRDCLVKYEREYRTLTSRNQELMSEIAQLEATKAYLEKANTELKDWLQQEDEILQMRVEADQLQLTDLIGQVGPRPLVDGLRQPFTRQPIVENLRYEEQDSDSFVDQLLNDEVLVMVHPAVSSPSWLSSTESTISACSSNDRVDADSSQLQTLLAPQHQTSDVSNHSSPMYNNDIFHGNITSGGDTTEGLNLLQYRSESQRQENQAVSPSTVNSFFK